MKHLVLLIHCGSSLKPELQRQLGESVSLKTIYFGNGSSAYARLAYQAAAGRPSMLEGLAARMGVHDISAYKSVTLASWSAGYGAIRVMLKDERSFERIDSIVLLDSWYESKDPDGTPSDASLAGLVRFALLARNGHKTLRMSATDVPTPYASTSEVLSEVARLAGLDPPTMPNVGRFSLASWGGLTMRMVNLHKSHHDEHVAALTDYGANEILNAVETFRLGEPEVSFFAQEGHGNLAQEIVTIAEGELGVTETPGSGTTDEIKEYHLVARRDGNPLGLTSDEIPWCASFRSWVVLQAKAATNTSSPEKPRISVRELWADAIAAGTARSALQVRSGEYVPQPGDALVRARGGSANGSGLFAFSRSGGKGHVGTCTGMMSDQVAYSIDGNVDNTVVETTWDLNEPSFVGVISVPITAADKQTPDTASIEGLQALDAIMASEQLWREGEPGIEDIVSPLVDDCPESLEP